MELVTRNDRWYRIGCSALLTELWEAKRVLQTKLYEHSLTRCDRSLGRGHIQVLGGFSSVQSLSRV